MSFLTAVAHWFATSANWWGPNGIAQRALLQVEIAGLVVLTAAVIGVGAGFLLGFVGRGGFLAVNAANASRAIPSLALLTLLVIWPAVSLNGGGFEAAFLTLVALGVPPVLTNAYVAMREVDADVREAGRAMGLSPLRRFFLLEAPLATPLAVAGIRTAAVEVMATSTLAAYVSFNDLGGFIFAGLAENDAVETFAGALLVALLAGLTDLVLLGLYRALTPAPIRLASRSGPVVVRRSARVGVDPA